MMIVSAYVFWNCLAAIYMAVVSVVLLKKLTISYKHIIIIDVLVALSFFVGSRVLYAILYPSRIIALPSRLWALKLVNFSLYGGLIMALLVWLLIGRLWQLKQVRLADQFVPHLGGAIILSKLGCFFNGCCYGIATHVPWAMYFERAEHSFVSRAFGSSPIFGLFNSSAHILRHPTQLYEIAVAAITVCAICCLWYIKRSRPSTSWLNHDGVVLAFFCLIFSLGRLLVFYYREFDGATPLSNFVRGPLLYGAIIVMSGLFIIRKVIKNKKKQPTLIGDC